jgi:hypothetical protein
MLPAPGNISQKYLTQKKAAGVTQAVEHLPSKYEALSSTFYHQGGWKERILDDKLLDWHTYLHIHIYMYFKF